ncbi:MAG: hypothetical protein AAF805_01395 [Planctomycetota bacterium]
MNADSHSADEPADAARRWAVYAVLIAVALGQAAGKILAVNSVDYARLEGARINAAVDRAKVRLKGDGLSGDALDAAVRDERERLTDKLRLQRPFLSANDRSRWMAVRAIAENGNHHIDPFLEEPTWDTIDMVRHRGRDGELHLYSSKPPLLMTLLAGPYWVLMKATGTDLGESPYTLGRTLLLLVNGGAIVLLLLSTARLAERLGQGDIDRIAAVAIAALATQLSAFTPVLNNHLLAAAATAVACHAWVRLLQDDEAGPRAAFGCGVAASLAASFDLPALSLVATLGVTLAWRRPSVAARGYLPGVLLVAAAFFGTNYWAHNSLRPPYAHRSATDPEDHWYDYEYTARGQTRDSYWRNRQGIDVGEPSKATYAVHTLVGHHGVLSLTPVWALSLLGGCAWLRSTRDPGRTLAVVTAAVTAACLVFYIGLRPQGDRNYGGSTTGFRWVFWMAPLWTVMLLPTIRPLTSRRWGVALLATLVAWSTVSASYATWNPWTHPWLHQWAKAMGYDLP